MSRNPLDFTNLRRGSGRVLHRTGERRNKGAIVWRLRCDCGHEYENESQTVKKREDFACRSCLHAGQTKHALARQGQVHPLYSTWENMRRRCNDPDATSYKNYGARWITVCKAWNESFESFLADILSLIGERPEGRTLDRIDNDDGYKPGNVRWATRKEQAKNKRKST